MKYTAHITLLDDNHQQQEIEKDKLRHLLVVLSGSLSDGDKDVSDKAEAF